MGTGDPFERNWLEVRILTRLNDRGHPVTIEDLRKLVSDMQETITCTIFNLADEGLLRIFDVPPQAGRLVDITPQGKYVLFQVMNSHRNRCD